MKVCIISPFFIDNYEASRPAFVRKSLLDKGHEVTVITSNFSHQLKKQIKFDDISIICLKTLKYKNNVSILRFISHFFLSISLFIEVLFSKERYDIYYITSPFALTAFLVKFFIKSKVLIDIIDFWPNSLPFKKRPLLNPLVYLWGKLNTKFCQYVDYVISLSTTFLDEANNDNSTQILFGTKRKFDLGFKLDKEKFTILYLGNIGTVYDFATLISVLRKNPSKYKVEIIGSGDKLEWLKKSLFNNNIEYEYHGIIYDEDNLKKVISGCDIGFNGFYNTNASFSYKALSYFSFGIPIINSMQGDLYDYVKQYNLGINYKQGCPLSLERALCEYQRIELPSIYVCDFFESNLNENIINKKLVDLFESVYEKTT